MSRTRLVCPPRRDDLLLLVDFGGVFIRFRGRDMLSLKFFRNQFPAKFSKSYMSELFLENRSDWHTVLDVRKDKSLLYNHLPLVVLRISFFKKIIILDD